MRRRPTAGLALAAAILAAGAGASRADPPSAIAGRPEMRIAVVRGEGSLCPTPCPVWIAAAGRIDATAARRFRAALAEFGDAPPTVVIDSRGGLVHEALAIGRMLRRARATVIIGHTIHPYCGPTCATTGRPDPAFQRPIGVCDSSCVMILASGVTRIAPAPTRISVHRPSNVTMLDTAALTPVEPSSTGAARPAAPRRLRVERRAIDDDDTLIATLDAYFREMGISDRVLALMLATPPVLLRRLSPAELTETGLATQP